MSNTCASPCSGVSPSQQTTNTLRVLCTHRPDGRILGVGRIGGRRVACSRNWATTWRTCTIQVLPAPAGIFPHAQQAFLVERYVHDLAGTLTSAVATLGIAALSAEQAGPERLADLVRARWGSRHCIKSATSPTEDRSPCAQDQTPQVLAGLRNLAIGALRTVGRTNIASSLRWISPNPTRVLIVLGQPA
ncbi:MAG: hypothetical protein LC799_14220 [Actinobacteria bacterium]|nr:hypothetical protein [Actinomycetota bacterium]